jgi:hypothetical protein
MLVVSEDLSAITCESLSEKLSLPVVMITRGDDTGVIIYVRGSETDITLTCKQILKDIYAGQKITVEFIN